MGRSEEKAGRSVEKRYALECTERQLRVINMALEEFFRLRIGQFDELANDLAFIGYNRDGKDKTFDLRLHDRENAKEFFRFAYNAATAVERRKIFTQKECVDWWTDEAKICCDIHQVIRKKLWDDREDEKMDWCVDAREPMLRSQEPLAVCRRVEND